MNEMVERVAKAISGAPFPSPKSLAKARAAIEAMREPTEFMVGEAARLNHPRDRDVWRTMIDAALASPPEGE